MDRAVSVCRRRGVVGAVWRVARQVNARLERLELSGLVARRADAASQARTVATTRVAARALGLPERRAPRTSVQREHELPLARLVAEFERSPGVPVVRTEREARSREAAGVARYSADLLEASGSAARRWPDLVLEGDGRRVAVEVELTGKGTARLERIVAGYRDALWFDEVRFLAGSVPVARRLAGVLADIPGPHELALIGAQSPAFGLAPVPTLPPAQRAAVEHLIAAAT